MNKRIPYLIILLMLMLMAEETGVVVAENNTTKPHAIKASIYQRPISGVPIQPTDNTGTCNSEAGCTALEKACQKLKDRKFTLNCGTIGHCSPDPPISLAENLNALTTNPNRTEDTLCYGLALCNALSQTCKAKFKWLTPGMEGKCIDP
jgi:hypothetical protein